MAHPLLFDGTWLQQGKYESAEAFYQQVLAGTGGATAGSSQGGAKQNQTPNKAAASSLKSEIAQARQNIKQALDNESGSPSAADSQVLARIKTLEAENKNLKQVAQDLQSLVKKLDARVCALEKGGGEGKPADAPKEDAKPSANTKDEDDDDDDDFDPFADDDDESEDEETKKRLEAYHAKKAKKPTVIAKSSLGIDVKPWDDETDMKKLEECVRSIAMDGLLWGQSKLVPVGYGIKKLHINAVIEDDKVSVDDLEEKITAFEDYIQSMDIAFFQKI